MSIVNNYILYCEFDPRNFEQQWTVAQHKPISGSCSTTYLIEACLKNVLSDDFIENNLKLNFPELKEEDYASAIMEIRKRFKENLFSIEMARMQNNAELWYFKAY